MNNKIFILTGKSGSGKDANAEILKENFNIDFTISNTTRPIRPNEEDGVQYNFISKKKFEKNIRKDKMIEYRTYNTTVDGVNDIWFYGTEEKSIKDNKQYIMILDKEGLESMISRFGDRVVSIYLNTSDTLREERAIARGGFDKIEWDRRVEDDFNKFEGIEDLVDLMIDNNGTLEEAFQKVNTFFKSVMEIKENNVFFRKNNENWEFELVEIDPNKKISTQLKDFFKREYPENSIDIIESDIVKKNSKKILFMIKFGIID